MATKLRTFEDEFTERIDRLESAAHEVGLNFTLICRQAGISRATPDRWRRDAPKTIKLVAKIETIIERERARQAKAASR